MIILTIDTTGNRVFGILQESSRVIDRFISDTDNSHAELLLVLIESFLRKNNILYRSVDCFSIVNGPGSFVGLKVSVAFAKAVKCILPSTKIMLNSIFQILSFSREYDFVVLEANSDNLYISDSEQNYFYRGKKEFFDSFKRKKRIITNSHNVMDFLKSSNRVFCRVEASGVAALNYFRYTQGWFDEGEIKPIYIRESQINTKHE
jgi:tRNA A37 threonylcarbamoyladenosine modification protein TsaB